MRPRVLEEAEAEILSAMLFYEDRQKGLGQDYFERVSETIESIARDPRRYPVYEGKRLSRAFHRAEVDRFPYIVVCKSGLTRRLSLPLLIRVNSQVTGKVAKLQSKRTSTIRWKVVLARTRLAYLDQSAAPRARSLPLTCHAIRRATRGGCIVCRAEEIGISCFGRMRRTRNHLPRNVRFLLHSAGPIEFADTTALGNPKTHHVNQYAENP